MHLLDELEEAAADEVLASFDAVQRGLQEEQDEVEGILVVAVGLLVDSLVSNAVDGQATRRAPGSTILLLSDLLFFFISPIFFLASLLFDNLNINLLSRSRLLSGRIIRAFRTRQAPTLLAFSMPASLTFRLLALTLAGHSLWIRKLRIRERVVNGEAGLLDLFELVSFDQKRLLLRVEALILQVDVDGSVGRRWHQA